MDLRDDSSMIEDLRDSLEKSFTYWKYNYKDALKANISTVKATLKKLNSQKDDATQSLIQNRFSTIVSEICHNIVDQAASNLSEESIDKPRHSLESKRISLLKFIEFLEENQLFSYLNLTERSHYCSLFERIAGLQSIRQFQILNSANIDGVIKNLVESYTEKPYPEPTLEKEDNFDITFYSYVTFSPIIITCLVEHILSLGKTIKGSNSLSANFIEIVQCGKVILSYITSIINTSDIYYERLKIYENQTLESQNTFKYLPVDPPPINTSLDWLIGQEFSGAAILPSLQLLVESLCDLFVSNTKNLLQYSHETNSSDTPIREKFSHNLLMGIETTYSLCIHIIEAAFRIYCLTSPIDEQFVNLRNKVFPLCLRLERAASQIYSDTSNCGFDHTAEYAQKYCSIPTLIFVAYHNEVMQNTSQYHLSHLFEHMSVYPYFKTLAFQYMASEETHRHLFYLLPYDISNEAFKYLEKNPRLQWPLLITLAEQKSNLLNDLNTDWISIISTSKIDHDQDEILQDAYEENNELPNTFMKAFLAMYAVVLGSDESSERLFFLGMAKAVAKAGSLSIPNTALDSVDYTSPKTTIPPEHIIDDLNFELTLVHLQNEFLPSKKEVITPSEIILEVLKALHEKPIETNKERSQLRRTLREIAVILPRLLYTNPRASLLNLFWKLVLVVDTPLWDKLYSLDSDILDILTLYTLSKASEIKFSPFKTKEILENYCSNNLIGLCINFLKYIAVYIYTTSDLNQLSSKVEYLVPLDEFSKEKFITVNLCQHSLLYELVVKYTLNIINQNINEIAYKIDPKLSLLVQNCFTLYQKSQNF